MKKPPRNWKEIKCQKSLECDVWCDSLCANGHLLAIGFPNGVQIYTNESDFQLLYSIPKAGLGNSVLGVTFCGQENDVLVSDTRNSIIRMFDKQGQFVRTIDQGKMKFKPGGITTLSPDGRIYVCDDNNHCVCVFDVNGEFLFSFGSHGSSKGHFNFPRDLCFASDGFLYITDVENTRICVHDKDGKFIRRFTTSYDPWCIAATDCGHIIVTSYWSNKIMIYTTGGDLVHLFGGCGNSLGQFDGPSGVVVDNDGLIYIADCGNKRIQVFYAL